MLAELIEKYKVVNSVGNTIGRVRDIHIDLNTWRIEAFEISPGTLKKDFLIGSDEVIKLDETDMIVIVPDDFKREDVPETPMKHLYPFSELKKKHVLDKDEEKIGRIYNLEIPFEKLKVFKVWKILIKTGFSDRRLRISTSEVDGIMEDIILKGTLDRYSNSEE
jgi:sporulation protein YlmC with PRC-barrel domain